MNQEIINNKQDLITNIDTLYNHKLHLATNQAIKTNNIQDIITINRHTLQSQVKPYCQPRDNNRHYTNNALLYTFS